MDFANALISVRLGFGLLVGHSGWFVGHLRHLRWFVGHLGWFVGHLLWLVGHLLWLPVAVSRGLNTTNFVEEINKNKATVSVGDFQHISAL